MEIFVDVDYVSCKVGNAENLIEKPKLFLLLSRKINLKVPANPTFPIKPKNSGQKLGGKECI